MIDPPRDVAGCRAAEERGEDLHYLMFWGHRPAADGRTTASCFSQWWPASFSIDGVTYASAEHAMMAGKARVFGDDDSETRILAAPDPRAAKAAGRAVRGFDAQVWAAKAYDIVVAANVAKFDQNLQLREYLLTTAGRVLVEASPEDRIWGIGLAAQDPAAATASTWKGTNLLGFALMDARDRLG